MYLGYFDHGKASGKGAFIFHDGSHYQGEFNDNKAEGEHGNYVSKDLSYSGGFKENAFHGQGKEKGEKHSFDGNYVSGSKEHGVLKW